MRLRIEKSSLADLLDISFRGAVVHSRLQGVALMDTPSHFLCGLENKNGQKKQMMSLHFSTGQLFEKSADIHGFASSFYSRGVKLPARGTLLNFLISKCYKGLYARCVT